MLAPSSGVPPRTPFPRFRPAPLLPGRRPASLFRGSTPCPFSGAPPRAPFPGRRPVPLVRGAAPYPVRFLKRKRSKELETFNMADSLLLCRGHKINKEYKISLLKRIFYSKTLFQHCRADKEHKTDVPKAQNTTLYCSGGYWSPYSHNEKTGAQCAPHTANLFYFKHSFQPHRAAACC